MPNWLCSLRSQSFRFVKELWKVGCELFANCLNIEMRHQTVGPNTKPEILSESTCLQAQALTKDIHTHIIRRDAGDTRHVTDQCVLFHANSCVDITTIVRSTCHPHCVLVWIEALWI